MKRGRKPGSLCRCTCVACGAVEVVGGSGGKYRCQACRTAGRYGSVTPADATGGNEAKSAIRRVVQRGELQPATAFACVDCGKPAQCYDHRDYSKPLDVEPVCTSCNLKRGPAKPRAETLAATLKAHPDAYIGKRVRRLLETGAFA